MRIRISAAEAKRLGLTRSKQNPRQSKYGNTRTYYNGRTYDSKAEAKRAGELDILLRAGHIKSWEPQPKFEIVVNEKKICTYRADFKVEYPDGTTEIEDVKGVRTPVYKLKKKLVEALYGIEIQEL